jgi:hypothetical protein
MRLAPLLAALPDDDLGRLATEHVRTDEKLPRPQLCNLLETSIRSFKFVSDFLFNRQPPTFAILSLLLDAPGYELPRVEFQNRAMAETLRIANLIDTGDLLSRDGQLELYRGALYEARRNDLDLNVSEGAILAVLRRKLGVAQVEHFLIEHHSDFREFWDKADCFAHEENALRSAGIAFLSDETILIPEDVAPAVWQTLGIDMPSDSARRLFGYLSNSELADALTVAGSRTSGSKDARLERLLTERVQPHVVLRSVALPTLKEICRATDATVGGNKDELIDRIIDHFAQRKDQQEEVIESAPEEPRTLDEPRFVTLFNALLHQELTDILRRFPDLRQTGTKEMRIRTLWQAHLSEQTLLGELMNRDLEAILHRLGLRLAGSKGDRIERIIRHFSNAREIDVAVEQQSPAVEFAVHEPTLSADVVANQALFRQKASNPQVSLQPWLDDLLGAGGLVRCYATEDANPTKQLKNKLSQAASARGGLLVLLLSDSDALSKAREALLERWMTNHEWSKNVACIGLAHPIASPTIEIIIERADNPWARRLRETLFPGASVFRVSGADQIGNDLGQYSTCGQCSSALPPAARYCPQCGGIVPTL